MEPAGLLSLPTEVIQHLSSFFSAKEVLTLSQTCHQMRDDLNHDHVWQRYLPSKAIPLLKEQEKRLPEQSYILPYLNPPCQNWQLYMRRTQIVNSWSEGHFLQSHAKPRRCFVSGVFNKPKGQGQLIFKDKFLFLSSFINDNESDAIEVWDIENTPSLYTTIVMKEINYDSFFLMGDYLVVAECFKVVVYRITLPDKAFPVAFTFFIPERDVFQGQNLDHPNHHDFKCVGWRNYSVGKYFLSNKCGEPFLHVWDIFNATKIGKFVAPLDNCFSIVLHSQDENDLLMDLTTQMINDGHHYSYFNIIEWTFSDIIFSYKPIYVSKIIFYNNHAILFTKAEKPNKDGFYDSICTVYSLKNSVKVKQRRFNNANRNYELDATKVVNGTFVLLCFDCFEVINALTLETVDYFSCDNLRFLTNNFNVFGTVFIVACKNDNATEVWNIQKKTKVSDHLNELYTGHLYVNEIFTILVCVDYSRISVLHFK